MFLLWYLYSLETTGSPLAVVASWSMDPTLHVGDIVIIRKLSNYNIGDIVLYHNICDADQKIIVHRIINIVDNTYVLKGDANPFEDSCKPSEKEIFGRVEIVVPYLGSIRLMFERAFLSGIP
jgi:signal peptidase